MLYLNRLFASTILAVLVTFFSIFSIQNITPVSLKFLVFESISLPLGILLALSTGVGLIFGAIIPLLLIKKTKKKKRKPVLNREEEPDYLRREDSWIDDADTEDWGQPTSDKW